MESEEVSSLVSGLCGLGNHTLIPRSDACASVEALLGQLSGAKRKLDDDRLRSAEMLKASRVRLERLRDSHEAARDAALRRKQLDRLTIDYLLREGHDGAALSLVRESCVGGADGDVDPFSDSRRVLASLDARECGPALEWCRQHRSRLRKVKSSLEMNLHLQIMTEYVRDGRRRDALDHARAHIAPPLGGSDDSVRTAFSAIALGARTSRHPYSAMFHHDAWARLRALFAVDFLRLIGAAQTAPLLTTAGAGLAALKLPCFHACDESSADCPACNDPYRSLAAPLPAAQRAQSSPLCRVSAEVMDEDNPPQALASGAVYSRRSLCGTAAARVFLM